MSRAGKDGPANMTKEMLNIFAEAFGIREIEVDGKKQWSIHLSTNGPSSGEMAIFVPETKSWSSLGSTLPSESAAGTLMSLVPDSAPWPPETNQMEYFPCATSKYQAGNWADLLPDTPHNNFFRSVQWSNTALGPLSTWPMSLRLYLHAMLFQSSISTVIHWGQAQIAIYNSSFKSIIGSAHPRFMGASFTDDWHNLKDPFGSLFCQLEASGTGRDVNNHCLFVTHIGESKLARAHAEMFDANVTL
jgi:hypothetical protein